MQAANDQLRRALPPVTLVAGLAASLGATSQYLMGDAGHFRPWALAGHLCLLGAGLWWLRFPPGRAHLAALAVHSYLATLVGSFVWATQQPGSLIHLAVLALGSFYFLVDRRYLLVAQLFCLGWFLSGLQRIGFGPESAPDVTLAAIVFGGGLALHVGRVRVLRQLDEALEALRLESAERQRAQQEALEAEKLESLGVMAGGVAHDFNNLLVGIVGGLELAESARGDARELRFALSTIRESATAARGLCRKILDVAGGRLPRFLPVDVNATVAEALRLASLQHPTLPAVEVQLSSQAPVVSGDGDQLRQVILNLLTNAAEAMSDRPGRIQVESELAGTAEEPLAILRVRDEGPGIPDELRSRIFDPFFTTKFTGRGLGLSASAGAVRSHGGEIRLGPSERGACFEVALPVLPGAAVPDEPDPPDEAGWQGRGWVLLVDDEEAVRRVARRLLPHLGFEVHEVASGEEAVAAVIGSPGLFCAALVDATMPGLDGQTTLRALREVAPFLPVIVSSGFSLERVGPDLEADPTTAFLTKPYGRDELADSLRQVLQPGPDEARPAAKGGASPPPRRGGARSPRPE